ncbi:hypothetical protein ScPMuIL_001867 [Solemya velum]
MIAMSPKCTSYWFPVANHAELNPPGEKMINMYQNHNGHPKRRKKRPIHGTKTVEVTRGKSGYGFTISGQHPCVLSCIVHGSPAELAGLKPGDYLMGVNTEDVSKAPHDDVVRMVGLSTGRLTLQVAENYNSSDSSDDDYHHRTKSRYPNRVRPRHVSGARQVEKNSVERYVPEGRSRNQSQLLKHSSSQSKVRSHTPVGAENMESQTSQKSSQLSNSAASLAQRRTLSVPHSVALSPDAQHKPKQALIKSTSQGGKFRQDPSAKNSQSSVRNSNYWEGFSPSNVSQIVMSSLYHQNSADNAFIATNDEDCDCSYRDDEDVSELGVNGTSIRVIVGYIGSIEMPSSANLPNVRLQSIRNAVRRLRVEQKIHTLVLMEVSHHGVKLTNAMSSTIAHYPVDRLAFSGVCPDDKRFFGIVTLHNSGSGDGSSENGSQDEYSTSSSCHVFMVDPELQPHAVHAQKAKTFGVSCTPFNNRCLEFPRSTTHIILSITNLYKDHVGRQVDNDITRSQVFANPAQPALRSNSTTSNSDSGLGFGRDEGNERVCVVDMPAAHRHLNNVSNCHVTEGPVTQSSYDSVHHLSPGIQLMPTPRNNKFNASVAQISLNMSTSSEEFPCLPSDKLNVRAMPDPIHFGETPNPEKANPKLLREGTHKLLQARQRHASDLNVANSDQESQTSSKSDSWKSSSFPNLQRPSSAPFGKLLEMDFTQPGLEKDVTVEVNKKLQSPVNLPPAFKQIRSPSAPTITLNHSLNSSSSTNEDDDDDDDFDEPKFFEIGDGKNDMDTIIARFQRDKALGISCGGHVDPRRFSEGYALSKQREKEKVNVEDGEIWVKPSSSEQQQNKPSRRSLSQSHESLVALETDPVPQQKLYAANSVNSILSHVTRVEEKEDDLGRIAGWAVSFDKLLQDKSGIVVFTDFLKKEFSEENIIFWRSCEQYKKITDIEKRKLKAREICNCHVVSGASDPVNIDSVAKQQVERHLENPIADMFDAAQQQIFHLMRQDSYSRFLKSDLYRTYLMKEMEGKFLNLPEDDCEGEDKLDKVTERKKSIKGKENEDKNFKEKRRRSLLPWRQKNKQNFGKIGGEIDTKVPEKGSREKDKLIKDKENKTTKEKENNQKKGLGIDLSTMRKEVQASSKENDRVKDEKGIKFCRVVLPDGATTVVCARPGQSIKNVLGKLCHKRGLSIAAADVFLVGSDKPIDVTEDVAMLGSREVTIEMRVLFRLDLPNRKSIGVKAKPNRTIKDVLKPILNKYSYKLENIGVHLSGHTSLLDLESMVSTIENQRAIIIQHDENIDLGQVDQHPKAPTHSTALSVKCKSGHNSDHNRLAASLEELTNHIFEDVMNGKSDKYDVGILDTGRMGKGAKNEDQRSSGLFGLLRKESVAAKDHGKKPKQKVTFNLQKNGIKTRSKDPEDERLFHLLNRAQNHRLDDQRGLCKQSLEMPEFLRTSVADLPTGRESAPPVMSRGRSRSQSPSAHRRHIVTKVHNFPTDNFVGASDRLSTKSCRLAYGADARSLHSFKTFGSPENITCSNNSFSQEGIVPQLSDATEYFQSFPVPTSPDFDDPCLAEKSLHDIGFDYSFNTYQLNSTNASTNFFECAPSMNDTIENESEPIIDSLMNSTTSDSSPDLNSTLTADDSLLSIQSERVLPHSSVRPFKISAHAQTFNDSKMVERGQKIMPKISNHRSAFHLPFSRVGHSGISLPKISSVQSKGERPMRADRGALGTHTVTFV